MVHREAECAFRSVARSLSSELPEWGAVCGHKRRYGGDYAPQFDGTTVSEVGQALTDQVKSTGQIEEK